MNKKLLNQNIITTVLFILFLSIIFAFVFPTFNLIGRWSILNPDGTPSGEYLDFKKDSTYSITLPNGQIGENGNYLLKDSIFFIKNITNVCGKDYWGKYSLTFHGSDSIHFALIEDTCSQRKMDIVGFNPGLKRYKAK